MNAIDANMRCRREMENEEKKAGERCFFLLISHCVVRILA